jgi:hypothetical protein
MAETGPWLANFTGKDRLGLGDFHPEVGKWFFSWAESESALLLQKLREPSWNVPHQPQLDAK